jgi:hypothetical protein
MAEAVDSAKRVAEESSKILGVPTEDIIFGEIRSAFPWLKSGEIIWARNVDFQSVLFWVAAGAEPVRLNGPDGLKALSGLLHTHVGPLPTGLPAAQLAAAFRQLTIEPRGFVGSREFLQRQEPYLKAWLKSDSPAERRRFRELAPDPLLETSESDETWSLTFNYFNPEGGVEHWKVKGDRVNILNAAKRPAARDGTYRWPCRG